MFYVNKGYYIKDLCEVSVFCVLYNLKLDTYGELCKITDYRPSESADPNKIYWETWQQCG